MDLPDRLYIPFKLNVGAAAAAGGGVAQIMFPRAAVRAVPM